MERIRGEEYLAFDKRRQHSKRVFTLQRNGGGTSPRQNLCVRSGLSNQT